MPDHPSPPPQTKPAPAVAPRRPWYRLHWSTWIVIAAVLAFFVLVNLPGRINNDSSLYCPRFYEHGWPFVFLDRYNPPPQDFFLLGQEDKYIEKERGKTLLPWAESPRFGTLKEGFKEGDLIWLNKSNGDFTGKWYFYQRWLAADILVSLCITIPFTAAYEFWSRKRWHYSLRFLLLCVFLVAVGMAWWRTGVNRYERELKAVKSLHNKGFTVRLHCNAPVFLRIFVGKNNLRPFTHVDGIFISTSSETATDADLEQIGDLTRLDDLCLNDSSITDKSLERLQGLSNLKTLSLDGTQISDEGLKYLDNLPNLGQISLDNTKITGSGFKDWKNLPKLQSLRLQSAPVTDDSLAKLAAVTQIGGLDISDTQITDAGLCHLMEMPNLGYLVLIDLPITDAGLECLQNMPQLEELYLDRTKVTDEGLRLLAGMPKLTNLQLDGLQITDDGLKCLENMTQLERLIIYNTKVTPAGIEKLQRALPNCIIVGANLE